MPNMAHWLIVFVLALRNRLGASNNALFVFCSTVSAGMPPAPSPESYELCSHILDSMFRSESGVTGGGGCVCGGGCCFAGPRECAR